MILARFNNLFSVVGSRWANFSRWFHSVTHSVTDTIRSSKTDWIESIYVNRVVDRILCISLRMSASATKIYDKKSLKHRKKRAKKNCYSFSAIFTSKFNEYVYNKWSGLTNRFVGYLCVPNRVYSLHNSILILVFKFFFISHFMYEMIKRRMKCFFN